ncbi:MAG TPA: hypothetical protein VFV95_06750 [Vicinamibacterales bacterium]|nr:hypothetical protein [Vicinamibacterales bacterium]
MRVQVICPWQAGHVTGRASLASERFRAAPQNWQNAAPSKIRPKQAGQLMLASRARQYSQ